MLLWVCQDKQAAVHSCTMSSPESGSSTDGSQLYTNNVQHTSLSTYSFKTGRSCVSSVYIHPAQNHLTIKVTNKVEVIFDQPLLHFGRNFRCHHWFLLIYNTTDAEYEKE